MKYSTKLMATASLGVLMAMPVAPVSAAVSELVVTARKREENVQDIPVAVTAFSEQQIERLAIRDIGDVAKLEPNLQFDTGFWPQDTRVSIRGLFARAGRPSAAILIDGIDAMSEAMESAGGSSLLNTRLVDIERVEVVKGPQAALYGRGAFAGAVNYITRRPNMDDWGGTASVDIAEHGRYELRAAIDGPVVEDKLAIRANMSMYNLDGYYKNSVTGNDTGGSQSHGIGLGVLFEPTDTSNFFLNIMYSEDESDPMAIAAVPSNTVLSTAPVVRSGVLIPGGTSLEAVTGTIDAKESDIMQSVNPLTGTDYEGTTDDLFRVNLIGEWDVGFATFKSLTSYVDNEHHLNQETNHQDRINPGRALATFIFGDYTVKTEQFSQEFLLSSNSDGRVDWTVGVNYFQEEAVDTNNSRYWLRDSTGFGCGVFFACDFADTTPPNKMITRDTTSYSVFGLVSYDITDRLTATAEARYIYDEAEVSANKSNSVVDFLSLPAPADKPAIKGSVDDTNFVPKISLDYKITDDALIYGSIAKGYKPPAIYTTDIIAIDTALVGKEDLTAYEIGAKTSWLDNTLLLNGAIYFNEYEDAQTLVQFPPDPADPFMVPRSGATNAGKIETVGLELEALWTPTENLTFNLGYVYNDTEIKDLVLADVQQAGVPVSVNSQVITDSITGDFSGNTINGIPEHALTFGARYEAPLSNSDMSWFIASNGRYQGERFVDQANLQTVDEYWTIDAQAGLQAETWSLMAYVENLTDDDTIKSALPFIDQAKGIDFATGTFPQATFAYLPKPRVLGVRGSVNF